MKIRIRTSKLFLGSFRKTEDCRFEIDDFKKLQYTTFLTPYHHVIFNVPVLPVFFLYR